MAQMPIQMLRIADFGEEEKPPFPLMEAQQSTLRERLDACAPRYGFARGDFVQQRPGLGYVNDEGRKVGMMFWRMLDIKDPLDRMIIEDCVRTKMVDRVDCLVAVSMPDVAKTVFLPCFTGFMEPYSAEEKQ